MNIALLLKYEVGRLHKTSVGGTEQIFLEDIKKLRSRGYQTAGYARFANKKQNVKRISHHSFLPLVQRLLASGITLPGFLFRIFDILLILSEARYTLRFVRRTPDSVRVGYSTPLLPLFDPRSVVIFQNEHHRFFLWKVLYARYRRGRYLFCSQYLLRTFRKRYPFLTTANSDVLYNAVDTTLFRYISKRERRNKKSIRLLFASAWSKEKGLEVLLEALVRFHHTLPKAFTLTIASHPYMWYSDFPSRNTSYLQSVRRLLRRLPNVALLGGVRRELLPAVYRSHDYTVVPSLWQEPFGLVALESVACGTPVIAFRSGGLEEILSPENSYVVEGNLASLVGILRQIATRGGISKPVHLAPKNTAMLMRQRISRLLSYLPLPRSHPSHHDARLTFPRVAKR